VRRASGEEIEQYSNAGAFKLGEGRTIEAVRTGKKKMNSIEERLEQTGEFTRIPRITNADTGWIEGEPEKERRRPALGRIARSQPSDLICMAAYAQITRIRSSEEGGHTKRYGSHKFQRALQISNLHFDTQKNANRISKWGT